MSLTWMVWIGSGVALVFLFPFYSFKGGLSDQSMQGLNTVTIVSDALDGITLPTLTAPDSTNFDWRRTSRSIERLGHSVLCLLGHRACQSNPPWTQRSC